MKMKASKLAVADPARRQAVIYARVSSKEQEKEGFSIPAQLKLLKEYAAANGFTVVQEYVDVETAKQTGRAAFGEMVTYLKTHPSVRVMLVEKTSCSLSPVSDGQGFMRGLCAAIRRLDIPASRSGEELHRQLVRGSAKGDAGEGR